MSTAAREHAAHQAAIRTIASGDSARSTIRINCGCHPNRGCTSTVVADCGSSGERPWLSNRQMGQLAGLLAVVILPSLAGLAGVSFGDPAFAVGYGSALRAAAGLAGIGIVLAAFTLGGTRSLYARPARRRL
jgi:hypothetical protein